MFTYFSVGSFVWSHLNNLKVSARSSQMEIQAMLQNTEFSSKFNKAYFKFSRNYESSIYINEYGVGMLFLTFLILFIWIFQILIIYSSLHNLKCSYYNWILVEIHFTLFFLTLYNFIGTMQQNLFSAALSICLYDIL